MGSSYLEKAGRGFTAFAAIVGASLQTSSGEGSRVSCPSTTPNYRFAQAPDYSNGGKVNLQPTKPQPWYYSFDIERIFDPDGSMNISCSMLDAIKRDAAVAAINQYSQHDKSVNLRLEELTIDLVSTTDFLDKESYDQIRKKLIAKRIINSNVSTNDIYLLYQGRIIFNKGSDFLTKSAPAKNSIIAYFNRDGYPTQTLFLYLGSAYGAMLYRFSMQRFAK